MLVCGLLARQYVRPSLCHLGLCNLVYAAPWCPPPGCVNIHPHPSTLTATSHSAAPELFCLSCVDWRSLLLPPSPRPTQTPTLTLCREMRSLLRRYPDFPDMRAALAAAQWAAGREGDAETNWQRVEDPRWVQGGRASCC